MTATRFQGILTKAAICGLAVFTVFYFVWAAIRFGTDFTSGFEYFELNGRWVLASGFLLSLGVMRPRIHSIAGSIWILGIAGTVMVSQMLFWGYVFFDVLTDEYAVTSYGDVFLAFTFVGFPAVFCGWLAFAIVLAAFSPVKSI